MHTANMLKLGNTTHTLTHSHSGVWGKRRDSRQHNTKWMCVLAIQFDGLKAFRMPAYKVFNKTWLKLYTHMIKLAINCVRTCWQYEWEGGGLLYRLYAVRAYMCLSTIYIINISTVWANEQRMYYFSDGNIPGIIIKSIRYLQAFFGRELFASFDFVDC